ncbi:CYFA0S04e02410g1_1 [Cyberlindnera fabianii]|uniref:CYFA0S04e02410g1_1 n=1 Tax=Cyberlindnera fabianii TaxID=36022 RepID=A0A061AQZ6_CYBFA|nr:CYFA0S04e02410g1_1 [Cyberlindnera fabianii]
MPTANAPDYSVYLVTDSTMLPEGTTVVSQVEAALNGGATIVQLREKDLSTREFIDRAKEVHALTKQFGVPLIINDRVDVAIAVDCEGVHVGQDDMPATKVRQMIGEDKIIGVSTRDLDELQEVIDQGVADYVGIGAIYGTKTKNLDRAPMGTAGAKKLLEVCHKAGLHNVLIGGINDKNVDTVIRESSVPEVGYTTDGVAVVSCIMASTDAQGATASLGAIIKDAKGTSITRLLKGVAETSPLVHHITNNVVKNISANVTLAVGASPIMSESADELDDLSRIPSSCLVINTGTATPDLLELYSKAVKAYSRENKFIVFDPVGCGASAFRKSVNRGLLEKLRGSKFIIKGNSAEILALSGLEVKQKGVDSHVEQGEGGASAINTAAKGLCEKYNCTVVVTGEKDYVFSSDYPAPTIISGGDALMGRVTGTGCSLAGVIASFAHASSHVKTDVHTATANALRAYKLAGSRAAEKCDGPGTFVPLFLDALYAQTRAD